jgi:16S rRNA pseudouridine516 synthase
MFAATGNYVEALRREGLGGLLLPDGMAAGPWKLLSDVEVGLIFQEAESEPTAAT